MRPPSSIPHLDLQAEYAHVRDEITEALQRVFDSGQFVLGAEVEAFEAEFADACDTRHAVGCASGSDALLLALMALDLAPGDQVVCPSYTFFATASAITRLGATPVFADIDPQSFNLDPEQARKAAARCSKLRAFLPVDLFGQMADMDAFEALGNEMGVPVVADAAQSIGASDANGRRAGSRGRLACFSLYPTKNLGALGDAGAITTDDEALAQRLRSLRIHGAPTAYLHEEIGINSRLDALQAAVLRVKLRRLDGWNETRRRLAARYDANFAAAGARPGAHGAALEDQSLPLGTPNLEPPGSRSVYHQYTIRVPASRRDGLQRALASEGIGTRVYYPIGLHQQRCFAFLGQDTGELPHTEAAARESLCLPIHSTLSESQADRVVERTDTLLRG